MNEFGEGRSPFPRIHLERTNALDLFINFMLRNQPCIICASATAKWKSRQQWIKVVDGKSVIDVEFFTKQYGSFCYSSKFEIPQSAFRSVISSLWSSRSYWGAAIHLQLFQFLSWAIFLLFFHNRRYIVFQPYDHAVVVSKQSLWY